MSGNFIRLVLLFLGLTLTASAQITNSPWSRYGLGEWNTRTFSQGFAMGGLGVSMSDPAYIHIQNPASYGWFDMTVFELGVLSNSVHQSNANTSGWHNAATLSHVAFGFPVTRWWGFSFGLLPFTGTGYNIEESIPEDPVLGTQTFQYNGYGGINRVYLGSGIKLKDRLGLGLNASYLFGTTRYERRAVFTLPGSFNTLISERIQLNGISLDAGLQYRFRLSENWNVSTGLSYELGKDAGATRDFLVMTYQDANTLLLIRDTVKNISDQDGAVYLPQSIAGGVTFTGEKWTLGAEVRTRSWSELTVFNEPSGLLDNWELATGLQYIPDKIAVNSFFRTVRYRAGFRYTTGHISLPGGPLDEYGISFGFGVPLKRSLSSINAGIELSQRGKPEPGLIREQFIRFRFGITINDRWFIQRRYN